MTKPIIVCVEDDAETLSIIAEELEERGYGVIAVGDGASAVAAICEAGPDLVLCDVNMPAVSGFDILAALRQDFPAMSRVPFVFVTAMTDKADEVRGRRLGADDYVAKPIDFDVLELIVDRRLERAGERTLARGPTLRKNEIDVLTWAARGKSSDEIAAILGMGKRAVDFHIDSARVKLAATTRVQAAVKAAAYNIIDP